MNGIVRMVNGNNVWMQRTWDLSKGYGYHIQIYGRGKSLGAIGSGFSKNKFTSYRNAIKDLHKQKRYTPTKNDEQIIK